MIKLRLGLRNNAHEVYLQTLNGTTQPVLCTSAPEEEARREAVVRAWGGGPSPREQALATIDQALPQRSQTILSYRVCKQVQARLNGASAPAAGPRAAPADPELQALRQPGEEEPGD